MHTKNEEGDRGGVYNYDKSVTLLFLLLVQWESCGGGKVEAQNYISIAHNLLGAIFGNLNEVRDTNGSKGSTI